MAIGYACLALAVPGTTIKKCLLKNADEQRLRALITHNLDALERMIDYNISSGIKLYRISSDIIPFASSPINRIPWQEEYQERLKAIGIKIKGSGMRVSMHPGQYTVLNSPDDTIACNAMRELSYHAQFLDGLWSARLPQNRNRALAKGSSWKFVCTMLTSPSIPRRRSV
jgi:UV DNA damage endonuclease